MMKKLLAAAVCGAFAASALAAMPEKVTIVYVKSPFNLQNMVMKEKGMLEKAFEKDGVKVEWKSINSGAKQAQAMAAGAVDVSAVMNTASLLMANGSGNPVYVASGVSHPTDTFAIVGKPGASLSVKDLKGKKVAGPRGTVLHQLLIAALVKEGMSADDVEFLSMDIPAAMTAVTSGRVDAALLAASGIIKAEEAGCRVVTTAKGLVDVNLVMTASKQFAEKHPEALETVVRVEREADEWIKANWQEAVAIGAKEHGISLADAEKLAGWSHYYGVLTDADVKGLETDQKFLIENGLMTTPVDVKSIVLPIALSKPGQRSSSAPSRRSGPHSGGVPGLFSDCSGGFSRCPAVPSFRSPSRVMVMRPVPPSFFCRDSAWRRTPGPPNSSMRLSRLDSR